jgi:hypothetical protein
LAFFVQGKAGGSITVTDGADNLNVTLMIEKDNEKGTDLK